MAVLAVKLQFTALPDIIIRAPPLDAELLIKLQFSTLPDSNQIAPPSRRFLTFLKVKFLIVTLLAVAVNARISTPAISTTAPLPSITTESVVILIESPSPST